VYVERAPEVATKQIAKRESPGIVMENRIKKGINDLMPWLFTLSVVLTLWIGWRSRGLELITPEQGIGYFFGILGTSSLVILLTYPLRKRIPALKMIGSIKMWFRIHMILGIVGPVFILFHANFHLGSLNSNVALFSMLIVSLSGIAGRYIYSKIHHGLYGERTNLIELQQDFQQRKQEMTPQFVLIPGITEELFVFAEEMLVPSTGLTHSASRLLSAGWRARSVSGKISRMTKSYLEQYAAQHRWGLMRKRRMRMQMERKARRFLSQALKVADFNFYERLFSLWHILHLPLVFILVIAVIVHVVAVNRY
jgi:hypothetical protein